jgi:PleD family two-component response regulator
MKPVKERWKKKRRPTADQTGLADPNGPVGTTIPVVDDFEHARVLTSMFLRRVAFQVKEAATGMGMLALAAERPDLVILDVNLPDIVRGLEGGDGCLPDAPHQGRRDGCQREVPAPD